MSEKKEGAESGTDGAAATGAGVDPFAAAMALGGASRDKADTFLEKQSRLVDLQCEYLADKDKFELSHLRWRRFTEQMKGALQVMTAVVGIAFAASLSYMIWGAAHSSGLIIEPFAVPSDMAAKGLTGQVMASQMLDKLTVMQDATDSGRSAQSYANNWGDNIKVEIPETGVSIGEFQNFLKGWLGHDIHISGEVWRTQTGIAVTARAGGEAGATFTGPESDVGVLMQQAAEHVYGVTQPYRYANFLYYSKDAVPIAVRTARAAAIYRKLIAGPTSREWAWAWNGLGTIAGYDDTRQAILYYQKSTVTEPDFTLGYFALGFLETRLGRYEAALSDALTAQRLLDRNNVPDINPAQLPLRRLRNAGYLARATGDYREALRNFKAGADGSADFANLPRIQYIRAAIEALADLHDGGGLRDYQRDLGISSVSVGSVLGGETRLLVADGFEDWPTVVRLEKEMPDSIKQGAQRNVPRVLAIIAIAHVQVGDLKGANGLIAPCPADSDDCLIARGQIAEMQGQHGRADYWFDRVEKQQPSIPFANFQWGRALLTRGQMDGAIEKFKLANQKGPHFADPLEMWGEALMVKNQSHLALAKFAEAEKYAPNWGRLHLKWGEALAYAGKKDEAKKQFARAAELDLAPSEKAELARQSPHA